MLARHTSIFFRYETGSGRVLLSDIAHHLFDRPHGHQVQSAVAAVHQLIVGDVSVKVLVLKRLLLQEFRGGRDAAAAVVVQGPVQDLLGHCALDGVGKESSEILDVVVLLVSL